MEIFWIVGIAALGVSCLGFFFGRKLFGPKLPSLLKDTASEVSAEKKVLAETSLPKTNPELLPSLALALSETQKNIWGRLSLVFASKTSDDNLDAIEEVLYTADLGPLVVQDLIQSMRKELNSAELRDPSKMKTWLKEKFMEDFKSAQVFEPGSNPVSHLNLSAKPVVWLIVGVNGAGKTTSVGKLSNLLAARGLKVLVAAGDTFRAAAAAQLAEWGRRAGHENKGLVEVFSPQNITDPSAVAFSAVEKAKSAGFDIVLIDTAGRLHTQAPLMSELEKVKKVTGKVLAGAPHEILLVLDGNSGQNALVQAREFHKALSVTGVVLTKMDGTAKGGAAVGLAHELKLPLRFIGIGEKLEDLRTFSPSEFVKAILGE